MARLTDYQIADIRAANPIESVAGQYVKLRKGGKGLVGPCPICGGKDTNQRFEVDTRAQTWVCAACPDGGDVIRLVEKIEGCDFRRACDVLGGAAIAEPARARRTELSEEQKAQREAESEAHREAERARLYRKWKDGRGWRGSEVEAYLRDIRGIVLPPGIEPRIKIHRQMWFYAPTPVGQPRRVLHKGPAMLAAFTDALGVFRGLHITWLDLDQKDGKAVIVDHETGEVYPAKKMRGTKQGCRLLLKPGRAPVLEATVGEGIETVLQVLAALAHTGADLDGHEFIAAGDIGNIGGRATETVPHPTIRKADSRGHQRVWKVPGPVPDLTRPACPITDTVERVVQLGDGDSDHFFTRNAMIRGERRHSRPGRTVATSMAPEGEDFNSWFKKLLEGSQPSAGQPGPETSGRAAGAYAPRCAEAAEGPVETRPSADASPEAERAA